MSTPTAVDTFSRFMANMFDDKSLITIAKGFQAFFGRPETGAQTVFSPNANDVDIDIIRGNKKTAALIPRGMISRPLGSSQENLNVEKYSTFSRKYPLSEEEGDITGDQILQRLAGENPYEMKDRLSRMRILASKIITESIRRTGDMFERLAAQSILTGKQDAILDTTDTNLQYDFRRSSGNTIAVAVPWDNASAVIMTNIDAGCDRIKTVGRLMPDFIGIGGEAMAALIADSEVQVLADNRRFELIEVATNNPVPPKFNRFIEAGWVARGRLRTPKGYVLWMFTNQDYYENSSGTVVDLLPQDNAVIASTQARCDRYFGPPELLPIIPMRRQLYTEMFGISIDSPPMPMDTTKGGIITPAMFYHDAYVSGDWKKVTVRTQSAPIFATTHTDAFVTLTGLIT